MHTLDSICSDRNEVDRKAPLDEKEQHNAPEKRDEAAQNGVHHDSELTEDIHEAHCPHYPGHPKNPQNTEPRQHGHDLRGIGIAFAIGENRSLDDLFDEAASDDQQIKEVPVPIRSAKIDFPAEAEHANEELKDENNVAS